MGAGFPGVVKGQLYFMRCAKAGGSHFRLTIVSPRFSGKDKITRHRMVYEVLGPLMQREIHALAIRALTPDEL